MIYMIKIHPYILIIALSSCSGFDYFQAAPLVKNSLMGYKDIDISDEFYDQQEYSFAKIKIGRSSPVILSLAFIEDGIYEWISADEERIYTLNGKIIRTVGLDHNLNFLTGKSLPEFNLLPMTQSRLAELTNPSAMITQTAQIYADHNSGIIYEEVITSSFDWGYTNTYEVDQDSGLVKKSTQKIHPYLSELNIEFFYKF